MSGTESELNKNGVRPLLLATLALLGTMAPFATDMYLPSFPQVASDLHTSAPSVQLTLTTFFIGVAVGQLFFGPLSDRLGRRRPLIVATVVAVLAGAGCAVSNDIWLLTGLRFVQGFAGSAGVVVGRAVAADLTTGRSSARIFSLLASAGGVAPVIAPLIGGVLAGGPGWRGVFWVLSGIALLMFFSALFIVPESLPVSKRHSGELSHTFKVINTLVRDRNYIGYTLAFAFGFGSLMSWIGASPFLVQNVLGLTVTEYTIVFAVNASGLIAAGLISARLVRRFQPASILGVAQKFVFVFSVLVLLALLFGLSAWFVLPAIFATVFSIAFSNGNAAALAIGSARWAAGTAAAFMGALQFVLGALVAPLAGVGGSNTGVPMAILMVSCSAIGLSGRWLAHSKVVVVAPPKGSGST